MTDTLTPEGAAHLRAVRDHIVAHPEELDLRSFCGSVCCIGGHLATRLNIDIRAGVCHFLTKLYVGLGFDASDGWRAYWDRGHNLFAVRCHYDRPQVQEAVERINAFLWQYGYPPNAVEELKLNEEVHTDEVQA